MDSVGLEDECFKSSHWYQAVVGTYFYWDFAKTYHQPLNKDQSNREVPFDLYWGGGGGKKITMEASSFLFICMEILPFPLLITEIRIMIDILLNNTVLLICRGQHYLVSMVGCVLVAHPWLYLKVVGNFHSTHPYFWHHLLDSQVRYHWPLFFCICNQFVSITFSSWDNLRYKVGKSLQQNQPKMPDL